MTHLKPDANAIKVNPNTITEAIKAETNAKKKVFSDYQWLCDFLGISIHTARAWVSQGRIPYHKLAGGSLVRFERSEIEAWLEKSRVEAYDE